MSHEHLGLFDTPPTRRENMLALGIVGVLCVALVLLLPVDNRRPGEVAAFMPMICAFMMLGEAIIATLLYAQAAVFRSRALALLASGYVTTALLLIPYVLTFPGAFARDGLLHAGVSTTAWLMVFRRWTDPISVMLYVALRRADLPPRDAGRGPPRTLLYVMVAGAVAGALTLLATRGQGLLPPMFASRAVVVAPNLLAFNLSLISLLIAAIALLWRARRSILDTWLLVSLAAGVIQAVLNIPLHARFTVGFYALFLLMLASHLIVMLALIAESNRLYVRLALSTAARSRELDARMMSMDGVAAAISHEVGQPLAAVSLSASAALNALTRETPDPEKAIQSLRDTVAGAQRALAVAKSVRAMFGKKTNWRSAFDLNDLVRECASLLDRDMAAQGVSLRLALEAELPPVLANRVQIQRVLVNLLTNAIESLGASERRARRIAVRSAANGGQSVCVEVSDSGGGIAPEAMARIFEPFFTTKASGTGLGLSLSRSIAEDHGGRLWASQAEDGGATFHLELRCAPAPG